jgi:hypothetical protein
MASKSKFKTCHLHELAQALSKSKPQVVTISDPTGRVWKQKLVRNAKEGFEYASKHMTEGDTWSMEEVKTAVTRENATRHSTSRSK